MTTIPTQIRIDKEVKEDATALFKELGLDMSTAVNMFLRQCIMRKGLPFEVEKPRYKANVLKAIQEANRIADDPNTKTYGNIEELLEELLDK